MKKDRYNPVEESHLKKRDDFEALPEDKRREEVNRLHEKANIEKCDSFHTLLENEKDSDKEKDLRLAVEISEAVKKEGGMALVVGGFARDVAMAKFGHELTSKDIDIEVYGLDFDKLQDLLTRFGEVDIVGASFGVVKIGNLDISIPRRDSKTGRGHKGFKIEGDPDMIIREAAQRRDFTINALALDPLTGEVHDFYSGIEDIKSKTIKATDEKLFGDDPLRVLRAAQFSGRFGFKVDEKTAEICRELDLKELPKERIGEEWLKLLMRSEKPSIGMETARDLEIIKKLHPELEALKGVPQSKKYHPEGDVWTHTKLVVDAAAAIARRQNLNSEEARILILSALCHDFGKPATTEVHEDGKITSYKHDEVGVELSRKFLSDLMISQEIQDKVTSLVREHMFIHHKSGDQEISDATVRRLAARLFPASIQELANLATADKRGGTLASDQEYSAAELLLKRADELSIKESKPKPIAMGRHLLEVGFVPGKAVGAALKEIYDLQLEGKIVNLDEAKNYAKLLFFINETQDRNIKFVELLNGIAMDKEEMISFIKQRFATEKVHDMGTLTMTLILKGESLPPVLEKNKIAILTAHKFGPVWFSHLNKEFYSSSWKSFYGRFEADIKDKLDELKLLSYDDQLNIGLDLIKNIDKESIENYDKTFGIKPIKSDGKFALYSTDGYPFEAGMFEGFKIMVQYDPERKRIAISVLDEDPNKVEQIDEQIRKILPEFAKAKHVGYLFAEDESGQDNIYNPEDAEKIYQTLVESIN